MITFSTCEGTKYCPDFCGGVYIARYHTAIKIGCCAESLNGTALPKVVISGSPLKAARRLQSNFAYVKKVVAKVVYGTIKNLYNSYERVLHA
jgi:hypothetical protein